MSNSNESYTSFIIYNIPTMLSTSENRTKGPENVINQKSTKFGFGKQRSFEVNSNFIARILPSGSIFLWPSKPKQFRNSNPKLQKTNRSVYALKTATSKSF